VSQPELTGRGSSATGGGSETGGSGARGSGARGGSGARTGRRVSCGGFGRSYGTPGARGGPNSGPPGGRPSDRGTPEVGDSPRSGRGCRCGPSAGGSCPPAGTAGPAERAVRVRGRRERAPGRGWARGGHDRRGTAVVNPGPAAAGATRVVARNPADGRAAVPRRSRGGRVDPAVGPGREAAPDGRRRTRAHPGSAGEPDHPASLPHGRGRRDRSAGRPARSAGADRFPSACYGPAGWWVRRGRHPGRPPGRAAAG
jgi:hypothetical protein